MSDKRFVCEVCSKVYNANFTLRRHVRKDHPNSELPTVRQGRKPGNDRNVACPLCEETFASARTMKHHRLRQHGSFTPRTPQPQRSPSDKRTLEFDTESGKFHFHWRDKLSFTGAVLCIIIKSAISRH